MALNKRVFITWGRRMADQIKGFTGRGDLILAGPQLLKGWSPPPPWSGFSGAGENSPAPDPVVGPLQASLAGQISLDDQVFLVYPPGAEYEALVARVAAALNLNNPRLARLAEISREGVSEAIKTASPPDPTLCLYFEAKTALNQRLAAPATRALGAALSCELPSTPIAAAILRRLCQRRETLGFYRPLEVYLAEVTMEAERGQDQNTLSFKARSETFGQKGEETIHAALSALAKRTVWVTSVMREPLKNSGQRVSNLLELALEAEGRKGLGLQETMVWLEFLYGQGLIRWPQAAGELFGPVGPKPIEQSPAGWRQTDQKSVAPDIDSAGCGFSCLSDEKPAFLEAPARLILEMIREGRDWERPIQSGEGLFLEKVILESEDSLNIYKAVLGPFVCGGGSGLSQGETLRVKGGRILLDWDPSPIPYTPASLAKDFCRPVPASLREFNVGLRELAKKKCFKYFQGALMPSELGRRCDRLLRNLSFSDPGYLRAIWERIWRAANSPGEAETKVLAILRKEENLAWTEAERLLVDKFSLTKLMMNESERPKERPDPKAKWDRPTFFA